MSEALTVLNNNNALVPGGGMGLSSRLFRLKPGNLEIVQPTSQQKDVEYGKFRVTQTNEHFTELQVVLIAEPVEQREYYIKGDLKADNKMCFSVDNVQPHARAKDPQAPACASCPMGDINWERWRKTHKTEDLPPCRKFWHIVLADRHTQLSYYYNIKGKAISPFEQAMANVGRLLKLMETDAIAKNRIIQQENAKLADGQEPKPYIAMPNLFDVTFKMTVEKSGSNFIPKFDKPVKLKDEDRASFGALFVDFLERRQQAPQAAAEAEEEVAEAVSAVTEARADAPAEPSVSDITI